jgi:hypothetical protein
VNRRRDRARARQHRGPARADPRRISLPGHIDWDVLGRVGYTMVDTQTGTAFYETQASELEDV